ncbi:hypothetical protein [Bacillus mycoides]|uniref:hypothetical protein n=1 Tax=Bacillus mycoides TaxID=1405 RepID=UPI00293044BB|nr:hypothetical protein [Bacillus mycoides]WOA61033.1 hypothetical protein RVY74_31785 [Bacillus mycoides]
MALDRWLTDEERARAAANGICRRLLNYRVYKAEWDLELALTAIPGTVRHSSEGEYTKWIKAATENGIGKRTFYNRLNGGWSCHEAATKPVKGRNKSSKSKEVTS